MTERLRGNPFAKVQVSENPVLRTQERLRTRLAPYFLYSRAVSFAYDGR